MNKYLWIFAGLLFSGAVTASAATEVEMEACHYTPEVKRELQLTAAQEPRVEKIYSELAPRLQQIQNAMKEREQLRQQGANPEEIEKATEKIIALENQCRERGHELLQPVLTDAQYQLILEMEEVHRRKVRERRSAGQPAHP